MNLYSEIKGGFPSTVYVFQQHEITEKVLRNTFKLDINIFVGRNWSKV